MGTNLKCCEQFAMTVQLMPSPLQWDRVEMICRVRTLRVFISSAWHVWNPASFAFLMSPAWSQISCRTCNPVQCCRLATNADCDRSGAASWSS